MTNTNSMPINRLTLITCILFSYFNSFAINDNYLVGARSAGMAHATVALSDIWSGHHNQAGIALIPDFSVGTFYENRYRVKELGLRSGTILLPTKSGSFGLNYTQFGFKLFQESKIGISYANKLGNHLWAGVQIDYFQLRLQQEYGSQSTYTFEAGILAEFFPNFFLGFHIFNPIQAGYTTSSYNENLPTRVRFGLAWSLSDELAIALETEKSLEHAPYIKTGIEYMVLKQFQLRAGFSNHPGIISMGIGYRFKLIKTDIAFSRHAILGYSPSISLNLIL